MLSDKTIFTLLSSPKKALDLNKDDWMLLIRILRFELLLGRFAYLFAPFIDEIPDNTLKSYIQKHLNNAIVLADRQRLSVFYECNKLAESLSQVNTPLYFLKGAAYTLGKHQLANGRTYGDIDLLVSKEELIQAENTLHIFGWFSKEINDYDEQYYRQWAHEIPPMAHSSRETILDLHHNIVPPISGRAPDMSAFLTGAIETDSGYILRPAALTLHSIVHLFLNEDISHGMRDIHDIYMLFTELSDEEYWQDLITLARDVNFLNELQLAILVTDKLFDCNFKIPTGLLIAASTKQMWLVAVYVKALGPKHYLTTNTVKALCLAVVYIRGHMQKMPLTVLFKHSAFKLWRTTLEKALGKSYFKKTETTQ